MMSVNQVINSSIPNKGDSNNNDCELMGDQPDPDYIKMFVGQVPRSMDEQQLKEMFEEFGKVHTINVLRDKASGVSKGECHLFFLISHTSHSKIHKNVDKTK